MNTIIKASGPGPSYAEIRRISDEMSDPHDERNHMRLSEQQEAAYQQAQRNDIKAARETLQNVFSIG